ncbi:DUF6418 domain-containing protein, partial [Priestia megaterium]|uniref:DUF6418 domain-containing protein n=1 Tax=Priestia megaterium TaxID=1404 RepID=UPI00300A53AD
LVLFLISYVIQGSKFSPLYLNIVLFLIPMLTNIKFKLNKKTIKRLTGVIIIFVLFISLIINFSVKEYSKTLDEKEAVDFVLYRTLGLQGHVWWGTDYLAQYLNPQDKEVNLHSELNAILLKDLNQYSTGLNSLMLFVSPKIGAQYIKNGISFTMGFPAILNINFNTFGVYVSLIILGALLGLFIYLFQKVLHSLRLIYIVIFGYIYIYGILQFFTMGRTLALFNFKIYLLCLLLIYIYICLLGVKKIQRGRRKPNIGYLQKEEHLN